MPDEFKRVECPEPVEGLCWVYMLLMCNDMLYVGQTRDVSGRLQRHTDGTGARQTRQMKEFVLVFVEGPLDPDAAVKRERQLKKWTRAKKMALIKGDMETLKTLSKSRDAQT